MRAISRDAGTVVPMMARCTKNIGAVASHLSLSASSMCPASGVAEMPIAWTDMKSACANANSATLRRWELADGGTALMR